MSKRWILVLILTLLLSGGSWYFYTYQAEEDISDDLFGLDVPQVPILPIDIANGSTREVTLFIVDPGSGSLIKKISAIPDDLDILEQINQTVQYLIQPDAAMRNVAIPEGTELLNVFITETGIAYLDLSRHLQDSHIGGLSAELATVMSLVNTLLFNFQTIKQVQILVEGAEIETLAGHIDCRKPFSKMLLIDS